jgi:hypothetical protein
MGTSWLFHEALWRSLRVWVGVGLRVGVGVGVAAAAVFFFFSGGCWFCWGRGGVSGGVGARRTLRVGGGCAPLGLGGLRERARARARRRGLSSPSPPGSQAHRALSLSSLNTHRRAPPPSSSSTAGRTRPAAASATGALAAALAASSFGQRGEGGWWCLAPSSGPSVSRRRARLGGSKGEANKKTQSIREKRGIDWCCCRGAASRGGGAAQPSGRPPQGGACGGRRCRRRRCLLPLFRAPPRPSFASPSFTAVGARRNKLPKMPKIGFYRNCELLRSTKNSRSGGWGRVEELSPPPRRPLLLFFGPRRRAKDGFPWLGSATSGS